VIEETGARRALNCRRQRRAGQGDQATRKSCLRRGRQSRQILHAVGIGNPEHLDRFGIKAMVKVAGYRPGTSGTTWT